MSKKLVILGAGGYANTVKDVSEQLGYDVIAMLDDRFADRTLDSFTKYIADEQKRAISLRMVYVILAHTLIIMGFACLGAIK